MHGFKRINLFIIIFSLMLTTMPGASPALVQAQADDPVAALMSQMSIEDKVGQLFIVPFVGDEVTPGSDIWQLVTEYKVGGVILLAANSNFNNDESAPRQITELTNSLKTIAFNTNGVPLFVAVDHEGDGYPYSRITRGVSPLPSPMAIGAAWDAASAQAVGQIVGQELAAMGINLLLGPGMDVLNDPRPTGRGDIGIRVFGGDPYWVGQMGRAYIRGVHTGGNGAVATVAKHFPGHGGSDRLPDNEVATVDKSLQELQRIELPPFFEITDNRPDDLPGVTDALMSSHIRYRGFQGDIRQFTAPISFDVDGMNTLLTLPQIEAWRANNGLIISDALGVPAVRKHFDPALQTFPHRRIAKEAFLAGNDVLSLVQFDLNSIWQDQFANIKDTIYFFRTEYVNNPAFATRVDESVARILRLKLKLYPAPSQDSLNRNPDQALEITRQPHPVIDTIARQSLTLLYPLPEELRLRLPQPPGPGNTILIVTDTRLARECFTDNCPTREDLFLARTAVEDTILRFYGPGATGQIQPEQISSITFSELKMAMGNAIAPSAPDEATPPNLKVQLTADEVRQRIQAADWLIFTMLDLNTVRYADSDALKLFLAQEGGSLRDKKIIVLAFNAPYYLDTTEVTKLTAFIGLYSKTEPHVQAAVRALFGETGFPGASPVSVEGLGYKLVDVLSPQPTQNLSLELAAIQPQSRIAPVIIQARSGPVVDYNGHLVPDGTPLEFKAVQNDRQMASAVGHTRTGVAQAELTLPTPGDVEIFVEAGGNLVSNRIVVTILSPPTVTPLPATATPTESPLPAPTVSPPPTLATVTISPTLPITNTVPIEPLSGDDLLPTGNSPDSRHLDRIDFLLTLAVMGLVGLAGFWLGQHAQKPLSQQMRFGLWVVIGGLSAYVLYGLGWLRPEQWLFETPSIWAGRGMITGLTFLFALIGMQIANVQIASGKR